MCSQLWAHARTQTHIFAGKSADLALLSSSHSKYVFKQLVHLRSHWLTVHLFIYSLVYFSLSIIDKKVRVCSNIRPFGISCVKLNMIRHSLIKWITTTTTTTTKEKVNKLNESKINWIACVCITYVCAHAKMFSPPKSPHSRTPCSRPRYCVFIYETNCIASCEVNAGEVKWKERCVVTTNTFTKCQVIQISMCVQRATSKGNTNHTFSSLKWYLDISSSNKLFYWFLNSKAHSNPQRMWRFITFAKT